MGWTGAVQVAMRSIVAWMCALVALAASPAGAQPAQVLPDTVLSAIGRLNNAGYRTRNMCSATLVAPDMILTAAHCVPMEPRLRDTMRFVAGWDRGDYVAARAIAEVMYHPSYTGPTVTNIPHDVALLRLDAPISEVAPLPLTPLAPRSIAMAGYMSDRPHIASVFGPCPATPVHGPKLLRIDCPTTHGFSGAPVLREIDGAWHVTAATSAANAASTFAVRVQGWVQETLGE